MRKALIGMIMAATVMTPIAAEAQGRRGGGDRDRTPASAEDRAERIQERNERSEGRRPERAQRQEQPQQAQQPTPQVAQRRGGDGDGRRGGDDGRRGDRRGGGSQPSIYPGAWQGNPNDPRLRNYQRLERENQERYGRDRDRDRDDRDRRDRGDRGDRNWRDGDGRNDRRTERRRNWRNDWNRGWRNDRRYNWNSWRYSNRNIFRLSPYYSPYRGWNYRRFSIGLILQPLFYSQRYWIGDPWQYRLPPAPYGTQWVRYYDDVLLVDVYTGEVVDVIHDFFW